MTTKKYDLVVFIGRFQPFHNEHLNIVNFAAKKGKQVLILTGSTDSKRTIRNPFISSEVKETIVKALEDHDLGNTTKLASVVNIDGIKDYTYNDYRWMSNIYKKVSLYSSKTSKIAIIGHNKDNTSYYLDLFPQWDSIAMPLGYDTDNVVVSSTNIRNVMFGIDSSYQFLPIPNSTIQLLSRFCKDNVPDYINLKKEYAYKKANSHKWKFTPHPVIHHTVDSIVIQSGHVLLVTRKNRPGKGFLAFPGGYVDLRESLFKNAIRELKEETKLKVPTPVLQGCFKFSRTFDDPFRSNFGRIITDAFLFTLDDTKELPKVKGNDDAKYADWYPIGSIHEDQLYEDHYHILWKMLNSL